MRHSFIAPREKKIIGKELKWLLITTGVLFVLMLLSSVILNTIISSKERLLSQALEKKSGHEKTLTLLDEEMKIYKELDKLQEHVVTTNSLQKENIKNFFDLVPDEVVLKSVTFNGHTFRLTGLTLSRDVYNKKFQRSLDSLFLHSKTKFYKTKGGYRFTNLSVAEGK